MGTELNNFAEKLQKYKMPASGRRAELVEQRTKWQVLFPRRDCVGETKTENIAVSYVNTSSAYYFDRDDVALPGFHRYFKKASDGEREHGMKFMLYLNKRGGRIMLTDIKAPDRNEWGSAEDAMIEALDLEKSVNENLLSVHKIATAHEDANLCDFLETEYLQEQVDSIKEIADHLTNIRRVGEGLGVYVFDKDLH